MKYAIIDIETTGGSPRTEKITEIAIFIHDGKNIVDTYATLVNPEKSIPPYITSLTGISNEMVFDAPKFYEIAREIVLKTEDCIFVAHNVNFDYGFVKSEFKALGFDFQRKTLDTVRLSRKLLPGHASYSLGRLCSDLGIGINGRHRAAGDALATVKLFELLLKQNGSFLEATEPEKFKLLKGIDSEFHRSLLEKLPEETGVYYFFDDHKNLIYIGKSINIKKRVAQHFKNATGKKALEIREKVHEIHFELTGSELIALLLESDEIKKHKPVYNRMQRKSLFNIGLMAHYDLNGYINFNLERIAAKSGLPVASFANMAEAKNYFFKQIEKYQLCQKLCGLYKTEGACFHSSVGICQGACTGAESSKNYNSRAQLFIDSLSFDTKNFMLIDKGRRNNEKAIIRVKNGKYLGFGYAETEFVNNPDMLEDCVVKYQDNRDVQQIIKSFLRSKKYEKLINL